MSRDPPYPIYNGILKSFVRSSMNKISIFAIKKTDYFLLCVLSKSDLLIYSAGKHRIKQF